MKSFFKLCLLFLLVSSMSCSSDDDSNDNNNVSLEGTWVPVSLRIESAFDFNNDGTANRNLMEETPCYDNDFIEVRSDGTVNVVSGLTSITVEFTSPTEYRQVFECLSGFDTESTWTRDGNTITVETGSTDLVGTLEGNRITVFIEDSFQIEMYDGMDFSYPQEDILVVYEKQ